MKGFSTDTKALVRARLYRPVWLSTGLMGVMLIVVLGLLVAVSWRAMRRLEPVQEHLVQLNAIQQTALRGQQVLLESLNGQTIISPEHLDELDADIARAIAMETNLVPETSSNLREVRDLLSKSNQDPAAGLVTSLGLIRRVLNAETQAHSRLLARVSADIAAEFRIALYGVIAFPLLGLAVLFSMRKRILMPLQNLKSLMALLAKQDYALAPIDDADPMIRPLFENYNALVGRLAQLEDEHRTRQRSLEDEVRAATKTLLEQSRGLARAERRAATGEFAAGVAHELRNPLAGIQMTLHNLRSEVSDPDQAERLDLVVAELKRLIRLLNDLLGQARHVPEPSVELDVPAIVRQLLALARYQVPQHIRLEQEGVAQLACSLPEAALRQAVLNLVMNAAQALQTEGSRIVVSVGLTDERLEIRVADDGPGFPAELLDSGVRQFATWREQGTGLGLAMVRRFARDLGGDLELRNEIPRGASAKLALPCRVSRD